MKKLKKNFYLFILLLLFSFNVIEAIDINLYHAWTGAEEISLRENIKKYETFSGNKVICRYVPFKLLKDEFVIKNTEKEPIDIIIGPADWVGYFAVKKSICPLEEMLTDKIKEGFITNVLDGCKYNNLYYGLPESYKVAALIVNKDIVKKVPETTEQLLELSRKLTDVKTSKYGLVYEHLNFYFHSAWIAGFGGAILDNNKMPAFNSDQHRDALEFVKTLLDEKKPAMPNYTDYNIVMTLFRNGLAGMMINGPWVLKDLMESDLNIEIAKIPIVSKTERQAKPLLQSEVIMLSEFSKNKKAVFELINFLTEIEQQVVMVKSGHLPSKRGVYENKEIKNSKIYKYLLGFAFQAWQSVPLPTSPELSIGVWPFGNTILKKTLLENANISETSQAVQKRAETNINELKK